MKILQVAYRSKVSGGEKVLFDLAIGLKERGHHVAAVCPAPGQLPDELKRERIGVEIIPFGKTYDLRAARRLACHIRKNAFDVLHSHGMLTNILSRLAGRWAGVPVSVSTEHLTMELARGGRASSFTGRIKSRYYRVLDNYTSRFNGQVIAVSRAVRDDLVEQGIPAGRITVIRNGIRIPEIDPAAGKRFRKKLGIDADETVIGAVGRLSPQKDYPTLLRSFEYVARNCPGVVLVIAGDGYLRDNLVTLSGELGIGDRVRFLGYRSDVMEVIAGFDIYALSSLWEGLPLAVLEVMALGKPVVATSVPGTKEAVKEGATGFLVPLKDPEALSVKIIDLVKNPGQARKMGEAGRERAIEQFSLQRVVDEHEALYRRFIAP